MTRTATGWISQEKIMTYATPEIRTDIAPTKDWHAAALQAGLDWEPKVHQVYDWLGNPIEGYQAVAHGTDTLAVTSDKWRPILHSRHLREVVQTVMDARQAPIDAAVVLDGGARVGMRVTHGEAYIEGDPSPISRETWVWLRHDARGSLSVIENAQRMFCTNQLSGISGRDGALRVRHTGDVAYKVEDLVGQLHRSKDDWERWEEEMAHIRATPVPMQAFARFAASYIPEPVPPVDPARARKAQRDLSTLWFAYAAELGANAYAGYQAVVEFEDKVRASRGGAGRFARAIQPNPNKSRGLRMLMAEATR